MQRAVIADRRSLPRTRTHTSVAVRCASSAARLSRGSVVGYDSSSRGAPSPFAMDALRQSVAGRTSTASSVSFGPCGEPKLALKHRFFVPLHLHHVLLNDRAPNCRNDRAVPAHCRLSFLGSCSPALGCYAVVTAPDLRGVPPLPLHIWPQVTPGRTTRCRLSGRY